MILNIFILFFLNAEASTPPELFYKKNGEFVSIGSFGDGRFCNGAIPIENDKVTIYCRTVSDVEAPNKKQPDPELRAVYPCLSGKIHGSVRITGCQFGQPAEESYKNGLRDGLFRTFFSNHKVHTEQNYKADQLDGPSFEYLEDGRIASQSNYLTGQLEGKAINFNPVSEVTVTRIYKNGNPVGPAQYFSNNKQEWLIAAAQAGDTTAVESALKAGAKPNLFGEKTKSENAVIAAAEAEHLNVIQILLQAGGDLNSFDKNKIKTPLSAAISNRDVTEYLLQHGANPDLRLYEGNTALHKAAQYGYLETVQLLLAYKANSSIKNDRGETAADLAKNAGPRKEQILAALQKPESARQAVSDRFFEECKLKSKTIPRFVQTEGSKWQEKIAKCDPQAISKEDLNQGLLMAAEYGVTQAIDELVKRGADVNTTEVGGNHSSALMLAARQGKAETVEILLSKKAKIDQQDTMGKTALMYAVQWAGHAQITKLLLKSGANKSLKENDGRTALDLAKIKNAPELVEILK